MTHSHALEARWFPSVECLENRAPMLRALTEQHGLHLTGLRGDTVEAHLNRITEITFGATSVRVSSAPGPLTEAVLPILHTIQEHMRPAVFASTIDLQYLSPLDRPFEAAASQASHGWLASAGLPGRLTDCAILVDGEDEQGARFQAEFGVVDKRQARDRLDHQVGRMRATTRRRTSSKDQIPPVSVFLDIQWWSPRGLGGDLDAVWEFSSRCLDNSASFLDAAVLRAGRGAMETSQTTEVGT